MSESELPPAGTPDADGGLRPFVEPFAALRRRLAESGVVATVVEEDRPAWCSHRQHELDFALRGDGSARYPSPTDCDGTLRVTDRTGLVVCVECDACGFEVSVRMNPELAKTQLLEAAGIPSLFLSKRFDKEVEAAQPTLEACREWVRSFKTGPLPAPALWGGAGRGKSHLLCLMVETLIRKHGVEAIYRTMKPLMEDLRTAAREGSFEVVYRRLANAPVLALDDLGSERFTDAAREWFESLLDHRISREMPVIVATNYPPHKWPEAFGERAASRLRGLCIPLHLEGPDRRAGGLQQSMAMASP